MPDFERERVLFKEIERDGNLNEGDILKAINRLDTQIKEEEDLQASDDLTTATNPNVHPEIAAKFAGLAGLDVMTGDQLKAAKPALKRMSKTLTDPNMSADVREASLQRDREDVDQILLRSTTREGREGVEVINRRPGAQFGEAPFFPEPAPSDTQDVESFIQTLEPEETLLSGAAGQREINEAQQRNAIRISEFQASRAEQFTLGQGQQRFETKGGETTQVAEVAPKPVAPKAENLSEFTARLASDIRQKTGTPERQKADKQLLNLLEGRVKEGLLPGGKEIAKPVISAIQKEIKNAQRQLEEIERIEQSGGIQAISGLWNRTAIGVSDWASFLVGLPTSPAKSRLDKDFNSMMRIMKIKFRKAQTGVAFNPIEAEEYNEIYPNLARDGEDVVKFKMEAIRKLSERVIGSGQKFLSARDFLDAFATEIQRTQLSSPGQSQGAPARTTIDLSQFKR